MRLISAGSLVRAQSGPRRQRRRVKTLNCYSVESDRGSVRASRPLEGRPLRLPIFEMASDDAPTLQFLRRLARPRPRKHNAKQHRHDWWNSSDAANAAATTKALSAKIVLLAVLNVPRKPRHKSAAKTTYSVKCPSFRSRRVF